MEQKRFTGTLNGIDDGDSVDVVLELDDERVRQS